MSHRAFAPLPLLFVAAACSQPLEGRVAARLTEAGIPAPVARCMAERWVDRLSPLQLREISNLAETLKDEKGRLTAARFATHVTELDDPEIKQVVTRSAVICALTA